MRQIIKLLMPLKRRVQLMIARSVVLLVDDSLKTQGLQLQVYADDIRDGVERFQEYGFTSHPPADSEAIVVSLGGNTSKTIAIVIQHADSRLKNMAKGEVAICTDEGDVIHFKRGNEIHIDSAGSVFVKADTLIDLDGGRTNLTKGVVQGDCICAYTGAPHPQVASKVKASL